MAGSSGLAREPPTERTVVGLTQTAVPFPVAATCSGNGNGNHGVFAPR